MLSNFLRGAPASEPGGSTRLADLLGGRDSGNGPRMSLPEALTAIRNGTIPRPVDGGPLSVQDDRLPLRQAPAPKQSAFQDELDAQAAQDERDEGEFLVRAQARQLQRQGE